MKSSMNTPMNSFEQLNSADFGNEAQKLSEEARVLLAETSEFAYSEKLQETEDLQPKIKAIREEAKTLSKDDFAGFVREVRSQIDSLGESEPKITQFLENLIVPDAAPKKKKLTENPKEKAATAEPVPAPKENSEKPTEVAAPVGEPTTAPSNENPAEDTLKKEKPSKKEKVMEKIEKTGQILSTIDKLIGRNDVRDKNIEETNEAIISYLSKTSNEFIDKTEDIEGVETEKLSNVAKDISIKIKDLISLRGEIASRRDKIAAKGQNGESDTERILFLNRVRDNITVCIDSLKESQDILNAVLPKPEKVKGPRKATETPKQEAEIDTAKDETAPTQPEEKPVENNDPVKEKVTEPAQPQKDKPKQNKAEMEKEREIRENENVEEAIVEVGKMLEYVYRNGGGIDSGDVDIIENGTLAITAINDRFNKAIIEKDIQANSKVFLKHVREGLMLTIKNFFGVIHSNVPGAKLSTDKEVRAALKGVSNDHAVVSEMIKLSSAMTALYQNAAKFNLVPPIGQKENPAAKVKSGKKAGEPKDADRHDPLEESEMVDTSVEAGQESASEKPATEEAVPEETPTPEPVKLEKAQFEDMFLVRDQDSVTEEYKKIMVDKGFESWIQNHFNYVTKDSPYVTFEHKLSEEKFYEVYENRKPLIEKATSVIESTDIDVIFKEYSDEEKAAGKDKILAKWIHEINMRGSGAKCLNMIERIQETKELIAKSKELEDEAAAELKKFQQEGGKVLPDDVYEAMYANPDIARYTELKSFINDMSQNYNFYQGHNGSGQLSAQDAYKIKMFRRYSSAHGDNTARDGKIGITERVWTGFKNKFTSKKVDRGDLNRFLDKVDLLKDLRLVRASQDKEPQETANENMEYLKLYMRVVERGLERGINPMSIDMRPVPEDTVVDKNAFPKNVIFINDPANMRDYVKGKALFDKIYKPYTDIRAQDQDMQDVAKNIAHTSIEDRIRQKEALNARMGEAMDYYNEDAMLSLIGDEDDREAFQREVKSSVAGEKLKQIDLALSKMKSKGAAGKGGVKELRVNPAEDAKSQDLADIIASYSYVQGNLEKGDDLLFKKVTMKLMEKMSSEKTLTPDTLQVISQKEELYSKIAGEELIPVGERKAFFEELIKNLNAKADTAGRLGTTHIKRLVTSLEKQKNSIK